METAVHFKVATSDAELQQILDLQKQNQRDTLSLEEQEAQGFVYAQHTLEILKQMSSFVPQVIAVDQGEVVGYNLAMPVEMQEAIPSLVPMFQEFNKLSYKGKALSAYKFIVGGQVCVAASHRGLGLLKALYNETRKQLAPLYELCVTEISARNTPSIQAHTRAGFEVLSSYEADGENWQVVVCDWRNEQN